MTTAATNPLGFWTFTFKNPSQSSDGFFLSCTRVQVKEGPFDWNTEGGGDSEVRQWIRAYLKGCHKSVPLDFSQCSQFTTKVLKTIQNIPFGSHMSYSDVAKAIGKPGAARAVGNACNKNPYPLLIPCHRVISAQGTLGGYAYGSQIKAALLAFEKKNCKKVNSSITND